MECKKLLSANNTSSNSPIKLSMINNSMKKIGSQWGKTPVWATVLRKEMAKTP